MASAPLPSAIAPAPAAPSASWAGRDAGTIPLLPGESVVARFESSPAAQAKVARLGLLLVAAVLAVVVVPFLLIGVFATSFNPSILIVLFPLILILVMGAVVNRNLSRQSPAVVQVTDRRVIVQNSSSREASAAAINLENLGDVEVAKQTFASRRAGVSWVYFLPIGTPHAIVGRGRGRHAAPGVVWVPAVPIDRATQLRELVLPRARQLQSQLGYPTQPGSRP